MNKLNIAAISAALAVGSIGGAGVMKAALAQLPHTLQVQNIQLVRTELPDAGYAWGTRTCARELFPDGGIAAEPCWYSTLPASASTQALEAAVLAQQPR